MRNLRKGESYGHSGRSHRPQNDSNRPSETVGIDDAQIVKYGKLLAVMAKEFCTTDFKEYCPTKVINAFWSKYNWNNKDRFNLFDLVLAAKGAVSGNGQETKALDSFLRDFLSCMMAHYTVHHMNRNYSPLGRNVSEDYVEGIKEGVRLDFVGRLAGLR